MTLEDDRVEGLRPNAPVFEVGPVRARHRVPRWLLAVAAVGVLSFVGGLAVASGGIADHPRASFAAAASGPVSAKGSATGSAAGPAGGAAPGSPAGPAAGSSAGSASGLPAGSGSAPGPRVPATPGAAGSSAFLGAFDAATFIAAAPGGARCESGPARDKEVPRTRRDGPRITFQRSWIAWCPIPVADRQTFLLGIFTSLEDRTPADTFGYSTTTTGGGDALFPYAEPPLAGTVSVTADTAGEGLAIAIVVQEWRTDAAP